MLRRARRDSLRVRFLPQECFDLEHLVPQQALKADSKNVRSNPATPANVRAGNLLLCKEPLRHKGLKVYNNGCNSWKGRFYDRPISEIFSGLAMWPNHAPRKYAPQQGTGSLSAKN
jgi:hypothetical protein